MYGGSFLPCEKIILKCRDNKSKFRDNSPARSKLMYVPSQISSPMFELLGLKWAEPAGPPKILLLPFYALAAS